MVDGTSAAISVYASCAPEFIPVISVLRAAQSLALCVVVCMR
jgi:hypothetical protein